MINPPLSSPIYRPDIDGLRAIAVLAVVAFHAFPKALAGGFIGVDVFFVISGYLISTIIFQNLSQGTFSFSEFYIRRIRRLFPALISVLLVTYALGWFILLADEYKQLGKHMAAGAGMAANLIYWLSSGYFDFSAARKPLLHLWSLGVEEQFYLIWPFLIWVAVKFRLNFFAVAFALILISFSLNAWQVQTDTVTAFYLPHMRLWELACGSLLAWVSLNRQITSPIWSNAISCTGLVLLAWGFWTIDEKMNFPGFWALIPVLATLLIIAAGPKAALNQALLSNKVVVWLGLISYPLYLWHWPLLSYANFVEDPPNKFILIGASILLAHLTYQFVERPIRFGGNGKIKAAALLVVMGIVGSIGVYTYLAQGLGFRVQQFAAISKASSEWVYPGNLKPFVFEGRTILRQDSVRQDTTLFIGDSGMEQYYPRIDELITNHPEKTNSAVFITEGGCLPIAATPHELNHERCDGFVEAALEFARKNADVRTVVISAQWNGYFTYKDFLDGSYVYGGKGYTESLRKLSVYLQQLQDMGKRTFLVLNIPVSGALDPKYLIRRSLSDFPKVLQIREGGASRDELARYAGIQTDLKQVAVSAGAAIIQPMAYLCNKAFCPAVDDKGVPMYKDAEHLSIDFTRHHATFIDATILEP